MPLDTISAAPDVTLWKKLEEHQEATPASFSEAVLHGSCKGATLVMTSDQKELLPGLFDGEEKKKEEEATTEAKDDEDEDGEDVQLEEVTVEGVEVYIVSEKLILYLPSRTSGVEIPYPQITLHAITTTPEKKQAVYMQIDLHGSHASFDDHDVECLEITLVPASSDSATAQELYQALTDCSNLHPEPNNDWDGIGNGEDEEGQRIFFEHDVAGSGLGSGISFLGGADEVGGIPALAPGGWITAENADSISWTDGEGKTGVGLGSLSGGGALGPGAGTVRTREGEGEGEARFDDGKEEQEGGEESGEAKWRRTG